MRRQTHGRLLWAAATDATFERARVDGHDVLVGKCLHCNARVCVPLAPDGPVSGTVEHIEPRVHGGDDDVENLGVACPRCNAGKGVRLDHRRRDDPTLRRVVAALLERRRARLREPPADLPLPNPPRPTTRRR